MSSSQPSEEFDEEERQRKRAPWGVMALVLLTGLALIRNGSGEFDVGPPQPASAAAADRAPARSNAPAPLAFSPADRVRIKAIRVDAPVVAVGLDAEGWVDAPPPDDPNLAGWFTGAVSPGEKGTAVVVGHVDNQRGPAVFYGLGSLKKGNRVEVLQWMMASSVRHVADVALAGADASFQLVCGDVPEHRAARGIGGDQQPAVRELDVGEDHPLDQVRHLVPPRWAGCPGGPSGSGRRWSAR